MKINRFSVNSFDSYHADHMMQSQRMIGVIVTEITSLTKCILWFGQLYILREYRNSRVRPPYRSIKIEKAKNNELHNTLVQNNNIYPSIPTHELKNHNSK